MIKNNSQQRLRATFMVCAILLLGVFLVNFASAKWQPNETINASLPDVGNYISPSVFKIVNDLYLLSGSQSGLGYYGYSYIGNQWVKNFTINSSLTVVTLDNPLMFYKDSSYYLITMERDSNSYGYVWNGNSWVSNTTIVTGINTPVLYTSIPSVFQMFGSWYMINGYQDGKFYGSVWTGTQWTANTTIVGGLPTLAGGYSSPSVFYKDSSWYLIAGEDGSAGFYGYTWTGGQWVVNTTINESLSNGGMGRSHPTVFYKDSSWYLISGTGTGGGFNGFVWSDALPASSISVNLTSPLNNSILTTSSNLFNVSLSMTGTNYSYQWKNNTYNIWYNNGTLFNSTIVTGLTGNNTNVSKLFNTNLGNYLWNSYACYGNTTASNCSWSDSGNYSFSVGFLISSATYNSNTIPTSSETFLLQGTKTIFTSSVSAVLWYNGTSYPSTVLISGNDVNITNTITIPSTSGNNSFYWVISSFGTSGGVTQNSSRYYQTVGNLSVYACTSPPSDGLALNFTLYDESTKLKLNGSLETTFTYFAYGGTGTVFKTYNFASVNESKSNWMFCINSSGNASFSGTASYYSDYYDRREYIFSNAIVGNFTQNIPLYLSLIADTEVVTVTVTDQNYNPLVNALVNIQEWNVGTNTYSTIGMFYTDSNGNGIMNLELYNLWYRAIVSVNGQIVKTTDVQKLSSTTWAIIVNIQGEDSYTLFNTISHGLVFDNNTNITTFSWVDSSGYVNYGCLDIRNKTVLGYRSIHTECVSSVAGTINYQLVGDGDYEIVGTIYLLPIYNVSKVTDSIYIRLGTPRDTTLISKYGKVLSFIFIGVFAFLGVSAGSPILGIVLMMLSIFVSGKLGWLNITESILWGLISIALVIIFRQTRRGA